MRFIDLYMPTKWRLSLYSDTLLWVSCHVRS